MINTIENEEQRKAATDKIDKLFLVVHYDTPIEDENYQEIVRLTKLIDTFDANDSTRKKKSFIEEAELCNAISADELRARLHKSIDKYFDNKAREEKKDSSGL